MTTTIQTRSRSAAGGIGQRAVRHRFACCAIAVVGILAAGRAQALDIAGVLPNSIGLPEVNIVLRSSAGAAPYSGFDSFAFPLTSLRMIYDTGASGVIVFEGPAQALSLPVAQFSGTDIVFSDVGVGGSTTFEVSDGLHMSLGSYTQDPPNPYTDDGDYPRQNPGLRLQLGPPGSAALFISDFTQLGIVGMPAMAGRVSVINPKLAEVSFFELTPADTIHTHVYDPGVPPETGPGILSSDFHVELFMKSFDRFTQTTPAGATGPTLNANPFIGPDPLAALEGVLTTMGVGPVSLVNALALADERSIKVERHVGDPVTGFETTIGVTLDTGGRETTVMGAMIGEHVGRVIRVDDFAIDMPADGHVLILLNRDVPGVIGRVGTLLGEAEVNIGSYQQSRGESGRSEALAVIVIDQPLEPAVIEKLAALSEVIEVKIADLNGSQRLS